MSQIFSLAVGCDQKQSWKRVNIGFTFAKWPVTQLQMVEKIRLLCDGWEVNKELFANFLTAT